MRLNIPEKDLRTGDILVCSANRIISRAIKWFSKSEFSHTAQVIRAYGEILVVEAQMNGVHVLDYNSWVKKYGYKYYTIRADRDLSESPSDFAKKALSKTAQNNYDIKAIFYEFPYYYMTGRWIGPKTEAEALIDNKWNCSTLTAWLFDFEDWWKFSPEDVYQECLKTPKFRVL